MSTEQIMAGQAVEGGAKGALGMMHLLAAVVLAVALAVVGAGAAVMWLAKTGRLPVTSAPKAEAVMKVEEPKTRLVALEPLIVNLAEESGRSYLRIAMTLRIQDPAPLKGEKPKEEVAARGKPVNDLEAAERDIALTVIGRETAAGLLAVDGKENLKVRLRAAMAEKLKEAKVVDVMFTEFLVQR